MKELSYAFQSNPNKDFIRSVYDKGFVGNWHRALGRDLKYFGLPAAQMLDIIEWEEFLGTFTTIEREENQQHLMFLKANVEDVEHRLYSLYGQFDQIILRGRDKYGKMPDWPFDVVNLDYFGGFIYPNLARPKALRKLVDNQANYQNSFLLIVTQHLRDRDSIGEKESFLEDLRKWLANATYDAGLIAEIDRVINWYRDAEIPDSARQTLYMNFFLRDIGEMAHFRVACHPALFYSGSGRASMIHFLTEFQYEKGIGHRATSNQSLIELINLGWKEVRDQKIVEPSCPQPTLDM